MAISRDRTLVIRARPQGRVSSLEWPLGEPGELLDYSVDMSRLLWDAGDDTVTMAQLMIAPSGAGECQIDSLAVASGIVTAMLTGGPAGRVYLAQMNIVTLGGRTFEFLIRRPIDLKQVHWSGPPPDPPSMAFGTPVTWAAGGPLILSLYRPLCSAVAATLL